MMMIWLVDFGMIVDGFMVSNLNSKQFVGRSGQYKMAGATKESGANKMNVMEMQTHISMQEVIDCWNVTESGTGANELQVQEATDCWNVTEYSDKANDHQDVLEAMSFWNVTEHNGKANEHRVPEAMNRWDITEHSDKTMPEVIDCWDVAENSDTANGNQDAEANASWKDVERVGAKKGQRMHRGMQRAIDCWKSKKK